MSDAAPDLTTPIIACRAWKMATRQSRKDFRYLSERYRLYSTHMNSYWEPGQVRASCPGPSHWASPMYQIWSTGSGTATTYTTNPNEHHEAPTHGCQCGLWALAHWNDVFDKFQAQSALGNMIFGAVKLWGKVITGTDGWRAEYAEPIGFVAPRSFGWRNRYVRIYAGVYGVPVLRRLPELTTTWPSDVNFDKKLLIVREKADEG